MPEPKRRKSGGDPSNHIGFLDEVSGPDDRKGRKGRKSEGELDLDRLWER